MKKIVLPLILLIFAIGLAPISTYATHTAIVQWAKEQPADPTYVPHPGEANEYYWNGYTPKWINFTVKNNGPDPIKEIKVVFKKDAEGNSYFNFSKTNQPSGWYATPDEFGPNKRPTVIYFKTDTNPIGSGKTYRFDIYITEGPKAECSYNIDVWTVDAGSPAATNYHELFILIDKTLPKVQIVYPKNGTVFQDGETVWVNATASDKEGLHPSKIKKVELWFTYINKTKKWGPVFIGLMKYDSKKDTFYWKADPGTPEYKFLQNEAWHNITVIAYDYAENQQSTEQLQEVMFFWYKPKPPIEAVTIDKCFLENQPVGHVDSNAKITVHTGFLPYTKVTAKFGTVDIGSNTTDAFGQFTLKFKVPELPRGTYEITLTDGKVTNKTKYTIIPWVWIDKSEGYVDDEVTITGKGFSANAEMDVIYRDVSKGRYYDAWALEWGSEGIKLEWKPYLDNLTLTPTVNPPKTDTKGTFTFKFKIPQSYGGYHPIFAVERKTGVRSGWMPSYPQAALFKVKTKIWTEPDIGLSGQFVQIFGEGLPLPYYEEKIYDCTTKKTTTQKHNYTLIIDFGPNKYWIFEKGFILNNEFDYAWYSKIYFPFAYRYLADPTKPQYPDPKSPVWNGKISWLDADKQYHIGSPFLKVPALTPGTYEIRLYQFNITMGKDVTKHLASTQFQVLKDPLYIRVNSGTLYFSGENVKVYAEVDLDGTATDPTTITFALYRENTFLKSLTAEKITTGLYAASFTCPNEKGNYFIVVNATLKFDGFSLSGFGTACFTVSPTLDGFNATLTAINGTIATINTKIRELTLNITDINAKIKEINNGVVTIQTNLGTISGSLNDINAKIITLSGDVAEIKTDIGTVKTSLDSINTQVTAIGQNVVKIETSLGTLEGKITSIDGKTATISTSVGDIYIKLDSIKTETGLQPTTLGLSLIAAISAIIAAILIFRKLYTS
ncbi:MAG: Ig-like domain-containing protein [Conexivisphaerales archaeon]